MAMHNLLTSQWGRTFEALRDSPIATDAMGVGTFRHKVAAFALGSALGGLAGGLYAFNFQYLQPHSFGWELMVILLMGMVLGGRKSLWGALVGAAFIVLLPNLLSNRFLFQVFSVIGLRDRAGRRRPELFHGRPRSSSRQARRSLPWACSSCVAFTVQNIEDLRRAIFALMLFSVVVGLPEGLMGFAARFLSKLFHVAPAVAG